MESKVGKGTTYWVAVGVIQRTHKILYCRFVLQGSGVDDDSHLVADALKMNSHTSCVRSSIYCDKWNRVTPWRYSEEAHRCTFGISTFQSECVAGGVRGGGGGRGRGGGGCRRLSSLSLAHSCIDSPKVPIIWINVTFYELSFVKNLQTAMLKRFYAKMVPSKHGGF